jgi:UDP-N-acetylmuramoyl-tripeptide--D-alanyl-D-alanine ligase
MTLDLEAAARAMGASGDPAPAAVSGWSVDTRTLQAGDLYFALRGPNHDGHDFVPDALAKGAVAVVVEKSAGVARELGVKDTLLALQKLAAWARRQWDGKVVGVTGSAGKTTTKDAIAHLLAVDMLVGKTAGNLNNHVGVPLSILRLPDDCAAAVLEMGMNHAGEIRALAGIADPDIGVVTNVGYAHLENFDSIEGVAGAKRELIESLPRGGVAVLNADDPRVLRFREAGPKCSLTFGFSGEADVRAEAVELGASGSRFRVAGVEFDTTLVGRHSVMNLLAAIAVGRIFGIQEEGLRQAVRTFTTGKMRGERFEHKGITIWNDSYNSNPEAARSMIDVLRQTPAGRRIAILGEMLELGSAAEDLHRELGRYAVEQGIDVLAGIRGSARAMVEAAIGAGFPQGAARYFEDAAQAGDFVRSVARPGDAILFKGSRGVRVERALERFLEDG